jgi:hypothetical protein
LQFLQWPSQKLQSLAANRAIFQGILSGTVFALRQGMSTVRRLAVDRTMAVVAHPFMPYLLVLLALLRRL